MKMVRMQNIFYFASLLQAVFYSQEWWSCNFAFYQYNSFAYQRRQKLASDPTPKILFE